VPFVRRSLSELRERYVKMMHEHREKRRAVTHSDRLIADHQMNEASRSAKQIVEDVRSRGIIIYHKPWRGICLFPMKVRQHGAAVGHEAYFIYRDSRDMIDSWVLQDDFDNDGLFELERPIPESWKLRAASEQ
jgi:hypothetical protein